MPHVASTAFIPVRLSFRSIASLLLVGGLACGGPSSDRLLGDKPPELDDSAENLVKNNQFDSAVAKVQPVNPTTGYLHCENSDPHVSVDVYAVKDGKNLDLSADFGADRHGRIVAVVKNPNSCTTKGLRLPPLASGYWIVRHKAGAPDTAAKESIIVVVRADGTVEDPVPFRKRVTGCKPGPGPKKTDRVQIRDSKDSCSHRLDAQMKIQRDTSRVHDPTLWMGCSLTCCYADG